MKSRDATRHLFSLEVWSAALLALSALNACGGGDEGPPPESDAGMGGCMADTDCDDGNACTTDRCVGGACLNLETPAGSACSLPDGSDGVCDGAGNCTGCTDDAQCDDGNPCTDDACNASGACEHTDTAAGGSCALADGSDGMCDGAGACVQCTDDTHCDDGNPCTDDACNASGACEHTDTAAGGSCALASSASGYCDGAGVCAQCTDDTHCDDGNPCTMNRCVAGTCLTIEKPANQSCTLADGSSGYCDGAGSCTGCTNDAQCDDGDPCTTDTCNAGSCQHGSAPDGTACADDGDTCTDDMCSAGTCTHPARAAGLSCVQSSGEAGYCDGVSPSPSCVECLVDSHCDDSDPCTEDRCVMGACTSSPRLRFISSGWLLAAGANHTCLQQGTDLLCWGANDRGQLGLGDTTDRDRPVFVIDLLGSSITSLALGGDSSFAYINGVRRYAAWGANDYGQLGLGDTTERHSPALTDLNNATLVVGARHACRRINNGGSGVQCWGANNRRQLGDGSTTDQDEPVNVSGLPPELSNPDHLALGEAHTCVAKNNSVGCWGANDYGQAGPNGMTTMPPGHFVDFPLVSKLVAGANHTCAILQGQLVACWGANNRGQLGDGTNTDYPIDSPAIIDFSSYSGVRNLWAGGAHTCAQTSDGKVLCWGANDRGQLGLGDTTDRNTPTQIPGIPNASIQMTLGAAHSCALIGGTLRCWGANDRGQLGLGDTTDRNTPTQVTRLLDCR